MNKPTMGSQLYEIETDVTELLEDLIIALEDEPGILVAPELVELLEMQTETLGNCTTVFERVLAVGEGGLSRHDLYRFWRWRALFLHFAKLVPSRGQAVKTINLCKTLLRNIDHKYYLFVCERAGQETIFKKKVKSNKLLIKKMKAAAAARAKR